MPDLNLNECPTFDECDPHGSADRIQEWSKFEVVFDGPSITIGKKSNEPLPQYWTMVWERGFMATGQSDPADEKYAKMYGSLFIYLWCRSVGVGLADHLAHSFVYSRKKFDKEMEAKRNHAQQS